MLLSGIASIDSGLLAALPCRAFLGCEGSLQRDEGVNALRNSDVMLPLLT